MTKAKELKIIEAGDSQYMSEFMTDLPDNVMLNKVTTGCGGTTVALSNDIPYVIAVPYRAMITNKKKWADENGILLQPVMSGIDDDEILNFKGNKFIVTYDSLGRLVALLGDEAKNYKVLIDEAHNLVISGGFRRNAVYTVLENYKKFKAFTFMTATPVLDKYQLPELVNISKADINWNRLLEVKVDYVEIFYDFKKKIALLAIDYLNGVNGSDNMHVFMNSVLSIVDIVKLLKLGGFDTLKNVNIVCASTDRNAEVIRRKLGADYTISDVGEVRKLNFYTSTAFEGSDILDENGVTYIAVDGHKSHSKINILVTLPQIAGRIRNTKYKDKLTLLYTPQAKILSMDEAEYEAGIKKNLRDAQSSVNTFQTITIDRDRKAFIKGYSDNAYLYEYKDELVVNSTAMMCKMAEFHTIHSTYYAGGFDNSSGTYNGIEYTYSPKNIDINLDALSKIKLTGEANFKELFQLYVSAVIADDDEPISEIALSRPLIKEAFDCLGKDKVKALKYCQRDIKDEMTMRKRFTTKAQTIVNMLGLKTGNIVESSLIKKRLQEIYKKLEVNKTAKFSDIEQWYTIKRTTRYSKRVYQIITENINTN